LYGVNLQAAGSQSTHQAWNKPENIIVFLPDKEYIFVVFTEPGIFLMPGNCCLREAEMWFESEQTNKVTARNIVNQTFMYRNQYLPTEM